MTIDEIFARLTEARKRNVLPPERWEGDSAPGKPAGGQPTVGGEAGEPAAGPND